MKTNASVRTFRLVMLAVVIVLGLSIRSTQAAPYVVTLQQVGANVVATGSGALNLRGLSLDPNGGGFEDTAINPSWGLITTGAGGLVDFYNGVTGPASFGTASVTFGSGTGDIVALAGIYNDLRVPQGYVSDTPLLGTATYDNVTLASLGVTPGTYEWTWGRGVDQSFTLQVVAVPEPSTWALVTMAAVLFPFWRRCSQAFRSVRPAAQAPEA